MSSQSLQRVWRIETKANEGDLPWYTGADAMRFYFYTKIRYEEKRSYTSVWPPGDSKGFPFGIKLSSLDKRFNPSPNCDVADLAGNVLLSHIPHQ